MGNDKRTSSDRTRLNADLYKNGGADIGEAKLFLLKGQHG